MIKLVNILLKTKINYLTAKQIVHYKTYQKITQMSETQRRKNCNSSDCMQTNPTPFPVSTFFISF